MINPLTRTVTKNSTTQRDVTRTAGLVLSPKVQHLRLRVHRPDGAAYDVEVTEDALPATASVPST